MARILIIDDDEQVRLTLCEVVEALGHEVRTAVNGRQGLQRFEQEHFDAVMTDLAMPEVDGLTVLRRVKRLKPDMGVLVITGNSTVDLLAAAVNMGVDAYVNKPFKIAELDEQLSRILAQAHANATQTIAPIRRAIGLRVPIVWVLVASAALFAASRFLR